MNGAPLIGLTGGSGFIGQRFADRARGEGYRLRFLSRSAPVDADTRHLDLCAEAIDPAALEGCDMIVHLAAHIPRDHSDPAEADRCWRTNARGTLHLARAAAASGVGFFIQTTGANAYATWQGTPDEDAAMFPRSRGYYLGSKVLQEVYAAEIASASDLSLATLRLGSVYGAGQISGAVALLVERVAAEKPISLVAGGRFGADFVHVDDVVQAIMLVLGRRITGTFNVGSGHRSTIAEVVQHLAAIQGRELRIDNVGTPSGSGVDEGFPALSISRLMAHGYSPRDLPTGLASMCER